MIDDRVKGHRPTRFREVLQKKTPIQNNIPLIVHANDRGIALKNTIQSEREREREREGERWRERKREGERERDLCYSSLGTVV